MKEEGRRLSQNRGARFGDAMLQSSQMKERDTTRNLGQPLESGKVKEVDSPLESL